MRNLTANALAKIVQNTGNEPICIIEVQWTSSSTVTSYADKDVGNIPGKILKIGDIDEVIKLESRGTTSNVSVTIDDSDGSLLALIGSSDIHRRPCSVYQYFDGMALSDKFLLFQGWVASPITYSEGDRTLSFDILSKILTMEVGFSPEDGQLPNIVPDLVGHPWPLAFGNVINVPAVKSAETRVGFVLTQFGYPDITLGLKLNHLSYFLIQYTNTWQLYYAFIQKALGIADTPNNIINQYIQAIYAEGEAKQLREDMTEQLKEFDKILQKLKELFYEAVTAHDRADIVTRIFQLNPQRTTLASQLKDISTKLSDDIVRKKLLHIEGHNREYSYKVVKKIIDKMIELEVSYWDGLVIQAEMFAALFYQNQLVKNEITIGNGRYFPQGQQVNLIINGGIVYGTFNGNTFTIGGQSPRYTNIKVIGGSPDRPDVFYITDPAINLKGMQCLLPSGYIIHVTEQQGTECQFDLVENKLPTGKNPGDKAEEPPVDLDLNVKIKDALSDAKAHTRKETAEIINQALGTTAQGTLYLELKKRVEDLFNFESAPETESDGKDFHDAFYNNLNILNDLVSRMQLPPDIVTKANETLTKEDFDFLLKMQNLQKLEDVREKKGITPGPRGYFSRYFIWGQQIEEIVEASPTILAEWLPKLSLLQILHLPDTSAFNVTIGTSVTIADNFQTKFVANILPSTIAAVNAFRSIDGVRQLVPVPSSYYVKNENEALGAVEDSIFFGLHITSVTLKRPLTEYVGQGWEDQIYVSLASSVGPNVVDVLSWLITTYTSIGIDSASFVVARNYEINYPVGFAYLQQKEVMTCLEEIAWQARLRLVVKANIAYLVYLPVIPVTTSNISENDVIEKTMTITTTNTEDLVTELRCKYTPDYAFKERNYYIALRHNFTKYGRVEKNYEFYIYNDPAMVTKSATFWMIRLSNSFKILSFKCPLTKLNVETGDYVNLAFLRPWIANQSIIGEVTKASYNSDDSTIDFECWTPVRLGEIVPYNFYWPAGISITDYFPTILDINTGNAGNPIGQFVPSGSGFNFDPTPGLVDPKAFEFRPESYGGVTPSDLADKIPQNPLAGLFEIDYLATLPTSGSTTPTIQPMSTEVPDFQATSTPPVTVAQSKEPGTTILSNTAGECGSVPGVVQYPASDVNFDLELTQLEIDENGNLGKDEYPSLYSVLLSNGLTVKARQLQINSKSKIPFGTSTILTYDPLKQLFVMQVPVWLNDPPEDTNVSQ